jgi:F-type H+-transporting ATPase subunit delta
MEASTIARSYAESAFDLATKHGVQDDFLNGFNAMDVVLSEPSVRAFFESPRIDTDQKKRVLRAALGDHVQQLFMNFILIVLDKRRQKLYGSIANQYRELTEEAAGRLHVKVTLARQPSPEMEQDIRERLSAIFGKTVVPHVEVDKKILGGIIVRQGDAIIDGSLRRRLVGLRRRLVTKT